MSYGFGAYKKTSVATSSKEQILLMLYQAAIKNCKKAMESMEKKDIAKKGEYIGKMQDIVVELNNSLDYELGGEIAKELSSLYDYILFSSTQANIKMDPTALQGTLNVLNTLYDGWHEAVKNIKTEKQAGAPKGPAPQEK
jgi:flagellar protein FliS